MIIEEFCLGLVYIYHIFTYLFMCIAAIMFMMQFVIFFLILFNWRIIDPEKNPEDESQEEKHKDIDKADNEEIESIKKKDKKTIDQV